MVQFSNPHGRQEYELTAKVANADRLPVQFAKSTVIRPSQVSVTYQVWDGQWTIFKIRIPGPWILKGDRLSEHQRSENSYHHSWLGDAPDWAQVFAKENLPAAETVIP